MIIDSEHNEVSKRVFGRTKGKKNVELNKKFNLKRKSRLALMCSLERERDKKKWRME